MAVVKARLRRSLACWTQVVRMSFSILDTITQKLIGWWSYVSSRNIAIMLVIPINFQNYLCFLIFFLKNCSSISALKKKNFLPEFSILSFLAFYLFVVLFSGFVDPSYVLYDKHVIFTQTHGCWICVQFQICVILRLSTKYISC